MSNQSISVVFAFPGQGSYHYPILKELFEDYPETRGDFELADEVCRSFFGLGFLPLVTTADQGEHDRLLSECPNLDQVGIYLTEVILSGMLMRRGVYPAILVGHSFGELAALSTAGVFDKDCGLRIVCQRALAIQACIVGGKMAAVSSSSDKTLELIEQAGARTLAVSVINHPMQTVVSGPAEEIEALRATAAPRGVSVTILKSRYPFHSVLMERAVNLFRIMLKSYQFHAPAFPVYLCTERRLLTFDCDLPQVLSTQLVKRLDFIGIVLDLVRQGHSHFVECGAGDIVSRLITKNVPAKRDLIVKTIAVLGEGVRAGLERAGARSQPERQPGLPYANADLTRVFGELEAKAREAAALLWSVRAVSPRSSLGAPAGADNDPKADSHAAVPKPEGVTAKEARSYPIEHCRQMPVAIISMGCVLPGAADTGAFWKIIMDGVSGIVDLTEHDPSAKNDFIGGTPDRVVADKTYTLLNGSILSTAYEPELLSAQFSEGAFGRLTRGQRILALALAQTLAGFKSRVFTDSALRMQCILGSTADGSEEFDDALFADRLYARLAKSVEPESKRRAFEAVIEKVTGYRHGDSDQMTQHKLYCQIVDRILGRHVKTYLVDTACSSSLYSIDLAIKALMNSDVDLALAGGVFAPGPANNTLFAQFRGLTPNEIRPLDAAADGVVFGDGAGIVALKRLPDALRDGDRILAVVRGLGLSSDGRSPSINVPQAAGQMLAIQRAYAVSGVDMGTIQYVEAHATATPVGDATEFKGLKDAFSPRQNGTSRIDLGSVKSLIGHTGWTSGVASVIKFCLAFGHRIVPKQHFYQTPNREIDLEHSPFTIAEDVRPWRENVRNLPRRVGINGFGFGGTNAHLVMEEFDPGFHGSLCASLGELPSQKSTLAIVGVGCLFPGHHRLESETPTDRLHFDRKLLRLPAKKLVLPDVREHMDASQYIASLGAESVLAHLPEGGIALKNDTAVVLGLASKTERGMRANERIFLDRLRRRISTRDKAGESLAEEEITRLVEVLCREINTTNIPSGPYTLPGLMPNVAASRICSLFDLKGPNMVIDDGEDSLVQAILTAERLLAHENCRLVLAGGLNATPGPDGILGEAALLMGITTRETAVQMGFPIEALLTVTHQDDAANEGATEVTLAPGVHYRGACLIPAVLEALASVQRGETRIIRIRDSGNLSKKTLSFAPTRKPTELPAAKPPQEGSGNASANGKTGAYAFVADTPIYTMTPVLVPTPAAEERMSLQKKKILLLTDQPEWWQTVEDSGAMFGFNYQLVCPSGTTIRGATAVAVGSEAETAASLMSLDADSIDAILVLKNLANRSAKTLIECELATEMALTDLLFAIVKHFYPRLVQGTVSVSSVCLNAFSGDQLDPYTGLVAGFLKSLAREVAKVRCSVVNLDGGNVLRALGCTEIELGQANFAGEVCYRSGSRQVFQLKSIENLSADQKPCLTRDSVVIATGGGRGVTAVLCETLLKRFGCTVVALGRTTFTGVPPQILEMGEEEFNAFEQEFYREELAKDPRQKIADLRSRYWSFQAANELKRVITRLSAAGGRFEYHAIDITDHRAVNELVQEVFTRHGRVDMVLHGAGIQVSKIIPKKTIEVFKRVITTKLASLQSLYQACHRQPLLGPVHFHILTSAFSYLGNDGQPDYGAANEAMNRIAAGMAALEPASYWSAMAWLGWAGIGMTRGREFAALAVDRGLRGVTKQEGQDIFQRLMAGRPACAVNVLMAEGEIKFYHPAVANGPGRAGAIVERLTSSVEELEFTVDNSPFVLDHLVRGIPTLPGAFIIALVAKFAQTFRPKLKITAFEKTELMKFVYVYPDRGIRIRLDGTVLSEGEGQAVLRVRVLSDFRHKSGVVLQKDIVHTDMNVRMAQTVPRTFPQTAPINGSAGQLVPDPYVMPGSPVRLNGQFNSIRKLIVGKSHRVAEYRLSDSPYRDSPFLYLLPNAIMVDAFWRFGGVVLKHDRTLSVFVPRRCEIMRVFFDYTDFSQAALTGSFTFSGANPRVEGDALHVGPIEIRDQNGALQLIVEGGLCQWFGDIEHAF